MKPSSLVNELGRTTTNSSSDIPILDYLKNAGPCTKSQIIHALSCFNYYETYVLNVSVFYSNRISHLDIDSLLIHPRKTLQLFSEHEEIADRITPKNIKLDASIVIDNQPKLTPQLQSFLEKMQSENIHYIMFFDEPTSKLETSIDIESYSTGDQSIAFFTWSIK